MADIMRDLIACQNKDTAREVKKVDCMALSENLLPYAIKNKLIKPIEKAKS